MARIGILLDDVFKQHDTGPGHPERPMRLDAVRAGLERAGVLSMCERLAPVPVEEAVLRRLHTPEYIERIAAACAAGEHYIDAHDSAICPESDRIARLAAGGVVEAARRIGRGELQRAFCAVRPPGHHAESDRSMGFCLYNNVALAATVFRDEFAMQRILILDWDVHHGNGTQQLFESDSRVFFISLHGHPRHLYPGSGFEHETGVGAGVGYNLNVTFLPGAGDTEYRAAFEEQIIPLVTRYAPQVVLISAGFDAHADDPLGCTALSDDMFHWMSRTMVNLADASAGGRVLSILEGGYNLDVLRRCPAEHVAVLEE